MKYTLQIFLFYILLRSLKSMETTEKPPNIILILADDLGWNDVSFHGSPEIPTPNIDALAMSGIVLNNYYGEFICTPSRAALLSGKYPIRLGLQHHVLVPGEASGLPLNETTMPQHLQKLGYSTHMIGKWHLGYMTKYYTPTYRGFDSFFGYLNGDMDYYTYIVNEDTGLKDPPVFIGYDLHNGTTKIRYTGGAYATDLFSQTAENIIHQHDISKPIFLYMSHLAVHTPTIHRYHDIPPIEYLDKVRHIQDVHRRNHAGAVVALDHSVGKLIKALDEKNMLENTVIVFISDNGGDGLDKYCGASSNFPLRGNKYSLWEGGVRCTSLIWSPLFKLQEPRISMQMMHTTDWLPTFYRAAGGDPSSLVGLDGIDMWDALTRNLPSPRTELLHNIDPVIGISALRIGDMKVINGTTGLDSWHKPPEFKCHNTIPASNDCDFEENSPVREIFTKNGRWIVKDIDEWRKNSVIACTKPHPFDEDEDSCKPGVKPCLFNVEKDPCEYKNLASKYPEIVDSMMKSIDDYQKVAMKPQSKPSDPNANPICHDFFFVTWLDPENFRNCTF